MGRTFKISSLLFSLSDSKIFSSQPMGHTNKKKPLKILDIYFVVYYISHPLFGA